MLVFTKDILIAAYRESKSFTYSKGEISCSIEYDEFAQEYHGQINILYIRPGREGDEISIEFTRSTYISACAALKIYLEGVWY